MQHGYTIAEIKEEIGTYRSTILYYIKKYNIKPIAMSHRGKAIYPKETIQKIKHLQEISIMKNPRRGVHK